MHDARKAKLKNDVSDIGEVHAVIEEHDKDLEIRDGQVDWGKHQFTIDVPGHGERNFEYDRVIDWYEPDEMWH